MFCLNYCNYTPQWPFIESIVDSLISLVLRCQYRLITSLILNKCYNYVIITIKTLNDVLMIEFKNSVIETGGVSLRILVTVVPLVKRHWPSCLLRYFKSVKNWILFALVQSYLLLYSQLSNIYDGHSLSTTSGDPSTLGKVSILD